MKRFTALLAVVLLLLSAGVVDAKRPLVAKPPPATFEDLFNRTVASGQSLGTATTGQLWTLLDAAPTYRVSVDGTKANVTMTGLNPPTNHFDWIAQLGRRGTQTGPFDFLIEWTPTVNAPGIDVLLGSTVGAYVQTGYAYGLPTPDVAQPFEAIGAYGGPQLGFYRTPVAYTFPLGIKASVRLQFTGTNLRMRAWQSSLAEPSTWDIDLDSSYGFGTFNPVIDSVEVVTIDQNYAGGEPQGSTMQINHLKLTP